MQRQTKVSHRFGYSSAQMPFMQLQMFANKTTAGKLKPLSSSLLLWFLFSWVLNLKRRLCDETVNAELNCDGEKENAQRAKMLIIIEIYWRKNVHYHYVRLATAITTGRMIRTGAPGEHCSLILFSFMFERRNNDWVKKRN